MQTNNEPVQYYLDKDKLIDIIIQHWSGGRIHVSIYNDQNDTNVVYVCRKEELKGLADFIYKTIGEGKRNE